MRRFNSVIAIVTACGILTLAGGCTPRSTRPGVVVVRETRNEPIANVLEYANSVLNLAPEAQTAARNSLARQFQLTQFPEDRMRLALLDTLLPAPAQDNSEASALLTGYNWSAEGPGFKGLAGALLQILSNRKTQAEAHAKFAQHRTHLAEQLAAERAEKHHLQQQLDALERIEKTVNTRTSPTAPAAAGTRPPIPAPTGTSRSVPATVSTHSSLPAAASHRG